MAQTLAYRVEHTTEINGRSNHAMGCYSQYHRYPDDVYHTRGEVPVPGSWYDPWYGEGVFAFRSKRQLNRWFPKFVIQELFSHGFRIAVYDITNTQHVNDNHGIQCAFSPRQAVLLREYTDIDHAISWLLGEEDE